MIRWASDLRLGPLTGTVSIMVTSRHPTCTYVSLGTCFCNDDHSRISTRSEWPILVVNLFGADRVRYCIEVHRGAIGCHVSINFHVAICIQEVFQSFRTVVKSAARDGKVRKSTPQETKAHGPNKRIMMEQAVASQHTDLSDRCGHVQAVSYTIPS